MKFKRPCIECGQLGEPGYSRCPAHQTQIEQRIADRRQQVKANTKQYGGQYQRLARIIRQTATTCHLCGQPAKPNDPWEADHLYPGTPITSITQLAPAHRTCNQQRGNKPT
jgi:hypothetical protein